MGIRNLLVDFTFYGLLDLLQRSIGLVMVPLYTRVLSQSQYGDLDILLIVSTVILVLVDLQFVAAFTRFYLEYHERGNGRRFVGTILTARLISGIAVPAAVILLCMSGYADVGFLPSFTANKSAYVLVLAMVPLSLSYDVLLLQTRMLRRKRSFALGALSNTVVSCLSSVLLAAMLNWGIAGVAAGLLLGKFAGLLLLAWDLRREFNLCLDVSMLRPLAQYAFPLIPGWWLAFGSAYIGRFFVYGVRGADQNAILAVCTKIVSVIGLYSVSFRSAWQPLAMSYIGAPSGEAFFIKSIRIFMAGGLFSICWLAGFLQLILGILTPGSYNVVQVYFPLFAVATLIGECESNLQLGNQIAKKTHWISLSSLVYVAVNLAFLILFTKSLGIFAAGLGLGVSSIGKFAVTYLSGQRNWPISYDRKAFLLLGASCALLLILGSGLQNPAVPGWLVRAGMVLLGVAGPWLILDPNERRYVLSLAIRQRQTDKQTA